jgi:hypothetical protein
MFKDFFKAFVEGNLTNTVTSNRLMLSAFTFKTLQKMKLVSNM